jgi:hypothetical protein
MVVRMVHLACRVDLSHLGSGAFTYKMVSDPTFASMGTCGSRARTRGSLCALALRGARHGTCAGTGRTVVCVLRGNVPGHYLLGCGCVGPMRTSGPLRGGLV